MYADYEYYTEVFFGTQIAEQEFNAVCARASDYIDYITKGKATADNEAVKKAVCAVAEHYQTIEKARADALGGVKASESVGSWSVSYRSGEDIAAAYGSELYAIALRYLASSGLLYRGVRCGGCYL